MERKSMRLRSIRSKEKKERAEEKQLAALMKALKAIHSVSAEESMAPDDLARQRAAQELLGRLFSPMLGMRWEPFDLAGMRAAWVRPDWGHTREKIILYCHGGGFYLPLETPALELAAVYAQKLRVRVFLPEYRLLPEHPYPIPLQDCRTVWTAMGERGTEFHLDGRALLYGESAGGALAAGLAQQLRDEGKPIPCGQVLVYPALDDRSEKYPSVERYSGAVWTKRANSQMWSGYLKNGFQGPEGHAVPLRAGDFSRLSPAYVEPQGIDLLRDEGAAYGERLREAGVPVKVNIIEGSYHGFDADVENPFVQTVLEQRIRAMADMLADHKNEE